MNPFQEENNLSLEINNLSKIIDEKIIFENLNFEIRADDKVFLTGESGSGKSLLLRTIIGFEKSSNGSIFFQSKKIDSTNIRYFRNKVIYLSQKTIFSDTTLLDNLKEIYNLTINSNKTFNINKIYSFLEIIEKDKSFLDKRTKSLSGGESQFASILRAIQLDPKILLLDEPTSALDYKNTLLFEKLIDNWFNENKAFIWISHNKEQVERYSNRIINLNNKSLEIIK